MMISSPTGNRVKGKVLPIYNSGHADQANPSSVEITPGTLLADGDMHLFIIVLGSGCDTVRSGRAVRGG